jgi:hypothetical protein
MRHTFAILALAAGVPIEWVSKQLGHASVKTTLDHTPGGYQLWTSETSPFWTLSRPRRIVTDGKRTESHRETRPCEPRIPVGLSHRGAEI